MRIPYLSEVKRKRYRTVCYSVLPYGLKISLQIPFATIHISLYKCRFASGEWFEEIFGNKSFPYVSFIRLELWII